MPNFELENPGTWFYFNDDESQGGICLRELSIDENDNIEKLTVKKKKKFKRGIAYDDIKTDEKLARKLQFDYCIVDWKNVQVNGQDLECNSDNKTKITRSIDFTKFFADCISELSDMNKSLEKAKLKNSGSSSNGKQESPTVKTA